MQKKSTDRTAHARYTKHALYSENGCFAIAVEAGYQPQTIVLLLLQLSKAGVGVGVLRIVNELPTHLLS